MFKPLSLRQECFGSGSGGLLLQGDGSREDARLAPFRHQVQMVYLDPPFLTGSSFPRRQPVGESGWRWGKPVLPMAGYGDKLSTEAWEALVTGFITQAQSLLTPTGVLALHLDWHASARGKLLCDKLLGEKRFMNEIVWAYETGGRATTHFSRKHDTILLYAAGAHPRFDIRRVPMTVRATRHNHMKREISPEGRPCRTIRSAGKVYRYYDDAPVYPSDVWTDLAPLQQRDPERTGWPTQKPVALLTRLLRPVCAEGDWVADLCGGSGVTAAAAWQEGMRFLVMDKSPAALACARKRLVGAAYLGEIPQNDASAVLTGAVDGTRVSLTSYVSTRTCPLPLKGLDAVEQWSVGHVTGEVFYPLLTYARSTMSPALPADSLLPEGGDNVAVEIVDLWGDRQVYAWQE